MSLLLGKASRLIKKVSGQDTGESAAVVARKKQLDGMQGFYKKALTTGKSYAEEKTKSSQKGALFAAAFEEASKGEQNVGLANLFNSFVELESQIEFLNNASAENVSKDLLPRFEGLDKAMSDATTKRKKYNDNFVAVETEEKKKEKANQDTLANLKQQLESSEQQFEESSKQAIVRHETEVNAALNQFVNNQREYFTKSVDLLRQFQLPTIDSSTNVAAAGMPSDNIRFDDDESSTAATHAAISMSTTEPGFTSFGESSANAGDQDQAQSSYQEEGGDGAPQEQNQQQADLIAFESF